MATVGDIAEEVAAAWESSPVFVHPDVSDQLDAAAQAELASAIAASDATALYVAVLPDAATTVTGGSAEALLFEIGQAFGRAGTFAIVVGDDVTAGATGGGTPFEEGEVPAAAADAEQAGGDTATLLTTFVDELDATATATETSFPFFPILLAVGAGVAAFLWWRRRRRQQAELAEVREVAQEDLTSLGNELYDLDAALTMPGQAPDAGQHYGQAVQHYDDARSRFARARQVRDLAAVTAALERGRYAVACAHAVLDGKPLPEHRAPCFFDPRHGPSQRDVQWTPPGGAPRPVPACAADAQRVDSGVVPESRTVLVDGQRRAYWDTPAMYGPWAGGYYGAFGGMGFFHGLLFGSVLSGGWSSTSVAATPIDYGGYGGDHGGGDYGGGFGGGDFGGGFGGGDFGGGGD